MYDKTATTTTTSTCLCGNNHFDVPNYNMYGIAQKKERRKNYLLAM